MASIKAKAGEQGRLRPSIGSRPTSDTDDAVWEELLQGPDSASTGSSGSEDSRGCSDGPPMNTLSSDEDSRPQETSRVSPSTRLFLSPVLLGL